MYENKIDNPKIFKAIVDEFFHHAPVKILPRFEGQKVDNETVYIGCMAGPDCSIKNLLHEMSHLVEIDRPRMAQHGWGLKYGKYWEVPGFGSGHEPQTNQSVLREMRVWTFQYNVQQHLGMNESVDELASSATYLPAYCYMGKTDKMRDRAIVSGIKRDLKRYSFALFRKEWNERMEILARQKAK